MIDGRDGEFSTRRRLSIAAEVLTQAAPALPPGTVVAFAEGNNSLWLAAFLMLQKLGAVALPLDAALPAKQQPLVAASLGAAWLLEYSGSSWMKLDVPAGTDTEKSLVSPMSDMCLLKTTSGSTGQPRALAFTSENMLADGQQIVSTMEIAADDRNLGAIPFGHSYGLGNLVMPLLIQGTAVVCSTEILPHALATQIERFAVTVLPSVPVVLRALAESATTNHRMNLRSLRRVISAGAPLRKEVAAKFHDVTGLRVQNFYGSSETGGICFDRTGEATLTGRSIGRPMDGVAVQLNDEGRVVVRSPAVLPPGEWTLPDLGAWNEHGELALIGRAGATVNIGGKKVSPGEVERVLRSVEGVSDAWVGVQARGGAGGEAFLTAAVETTRSRDEVLHALADRLPAWQIPRRLWVAGQLPRTERGKLNRAELERATRE